jgi:uncharacterized membrane-anchored protein YhcB (DUF1043 family)
METTPSTPVESATKPEVEPTNEIPTEVPATTLKDVSAEVEGSGKEKMSTGMISVLIATTILVGVLVGLGIMLTQSKQELQSTLDRNTTLEGQTSTLTEDKTTLEEELAMLTDDYNELQQGQTLGEAELLNQINDLSTEVAELTTENEDLSHDLQLVAAYNDLTSYGFYLVESKMMMGLDITEADYQTGRTKGQATENQAIVDAIDNAWNFDVDPTLLEFLGIMHIIMDDIEDIT